MLTLFDRIHRPSAHPGAAANCWVRALVIVTVALVSLLGSTRQAQAQEVLCDTAFENCRTRLLELIANERVGIDVAFWFMEDARYTAALRRKAEEGVPVRVLVDTRANSSNPLNASRLNELQAARIPMRRRTASGILHWKMMLFDGQNTVQFSAANYSPEAFVFTTAYTNYIDEVIYYTNDSSVVNSFRTKFDALWTDTTRYTNYANITGPLTPRHEIYPKDPELNFPQAESFRSRSVGRYNAENTAIDVIMYRITDQAHSDAMIRAVQRGVPVRLITEPQQYRDSTRLWHSWNVDRMFMAGVQIRHRAHQGLLHQKSTILHGQGMTVFGSSNWTSPSSDSQEEHNYFTTKANFYSYFTAQFERKWNNGAPNGATETTAFAPLPPDAPAMVSPANGATGQPTTSVVLTWNGGYWAHVYDVYFGTSSTPPLLAANQALGPSQSSTQRQRFTVTGLQPGTTYYWRIVSKTAANRTRGGATFSFTTAGEAQPPPPSGSLGPGDVNLYAIHASRIVGSWTVVSDAGAAGAGRLYNTDAGLAKVTTASANPTDYFELTFTASAGRPYRLWIRGRAQNNHYTADSVHVQFSGSVNASGTPVYRIGTTSSTAISIEDCTGCGVSNWGWQDNGYGVNVLGPAIYFATTGTQTIRIQRREDGISIDQVLLSPERYLTASPGVPRNDTRILPEEDGGGSAPPPPPPPPDPDEIVLYASTASITGTQWSTASDSSTAGGSLIRSANAGAAKVVTALAAPASYFQLTFTAQAGTPYRLWVRGRAVSNSYANDSVHVQFSGSVNGSGTPIYRIGTTASAEVNLEDCSGCGVSGWGWQDNGYGAGVLGPLISFAQSGTQTLRVQNREDGFSIDQIVLSPSQFRTTAPGALRNDSTILPASNGGS